MQLFATILSDVCYRVHGIIVGPRRAGGINPRHHLKALFDRRLERGQCFRTPCLGWSEFTCSYWGAFRHGVSEVDGALLMDVPSMLLGVWDRPTRGQYVPIYRQGVRIEAGVLRYDVPTEWRGNVDQSGVANAQ
jgi:CRISPR-associated protein Cas5d